MANIMLTKACNLNCPYCFANQFVNKESAHITLENFSQALDFITRTDSRVGLIGGEPTIHPKINEIMDIIIKNNRIQHCQIYSNGIELDRILEQLLCPKFHILLNFNDDSILGETRKARILETLDTLFFKYYRADSVEFGINMYEPDFQYAHIIELCKRYNKHSLRVSICVPNSDKYRNYSSLDWFRKMKSSVLSFFKDLYMNGIVPHYDCNLMPTCVLSEEEKDWVYKAQQLANNYHLDTNIGSKCSTCNPVLDILPDLSVVRCFGMSHDLQLSIKDFANLSELYAFVSNKIDSFKYLVASNKECKECPKLLNQQCTGGCLAYKSEKIKQAYNLVNTIS